MDHGPIAFSPPPRGQGYKVDFVLFKGKTNNPPPLKKKEKKKRDRGPCSTPSSHQLFLSCMILWQTSSVERKKKDTCVRTSLSKEALHPHTLRCAPPHRKKKVSLTCLLWTFGLKLVRLLLDPIASNDRQLEVTRRFSSLPAVIDRVLQIRGRLARIKE